MKKVLKRNITAGIVAVFFALGLNIAGAEAAALIDLGLGLGADAPRTEGSEAKDFEAFASSSIAESENLITLWWSEKEVVVEYKESGHFLALLPIHYTARITAKPDGQVNFSYPWYSDLTLANRGERELRIRRAVEGEIRMSRLGSVSAAGEPADPKWTEDQALGAARVIIDNISPNEAQ